MEIGQIVDSRNGRTVERQQNVIGRMQDVLFQGAGLPKKRLAAHRAVDVQGQRLEGSPAPDPGDGSIGG